MDYSRRLAISYYKTIATINEQHKIYLVQHQETDKICVKKVLDVYNKAVFEYLMSNPIEGTPHIIELCEEEAKLIVIEEYISGDSLQVLLDEKKLTKESVVNYILQLCDIVEKMHNAPVPIIHRDIKPSNIIIDNRNNVVLLDFNAAKYYREESLRDTVLIGTTGYAAPEQYGFGSSTPQTDIYSIGILFKNLLDSLDNTTGCYDSVINKCIRIDPATRYKTISEVQMAILNNVNHASDDKKENYKKFLLPGFRTLTIWKMFLAIFGYICVFYLSFSLTVDGAVLSELWFNRILLFLSFIIWILFNCNYLDIHRQLPLCNSRNIFLKILGILICNLLIFSAYFMLLVGIENIFWV